jgi:hypothetical protein
MESILPPPGFIERSFRDLVAADAIPAGKTNAAGFVDPLATENP